MNKIQIHPGSTVTWLIAALLSGLAAGCSGAGGDEILGSGVAVLVPTVTAVTPRPDADDVAINTKTITAAFSKAMDPATLTTASFTLACPAGTPVTGLTVTYVELGNVATLTLPAAPDLPPGTVCTATVTTAARDTMGIPLASNFVWTFTTGATPDTTAPTVTSTVPAPGATAVAINSLITASFSEPMDPLTITTATFSLACPIGTPITGTVGYAANGNTATFHPVGNLPASTACRATVTTGAEDVAGNAMATNFVWNFTTGAAPDTSAPIVSSTTPLANATGVALNAMVTASFSEPMDPLTVTTATFSLACPVGTPITGTVGYAANGNVATFDPVSNLPASTTCRATITTGVEDVAGNAMAANFVWNFTTGAAADTTAPTVSSTTPVPNATGVAINTLVTASFSEPMDPLTITTATFSLACPIGTPITGTVGYAVNGNTATFNPASDLPANTLCRATITTGVEDVAGNNMAANFVWNFTTGVAPDTTPPTVISTNPAAAALNVCPNATANATFSEPMDPLTISTTTFTLRETFGAAVTGLVSYDALTRIATFEPTVNLTPSINYTATVKGGASGVKDLAVPANPMASDFSWTFTAGPATGACLEPVALQAAAPFGTMGGSAGMTNQGLLTVVNGDIGTTAVSTAVTGFHDSGPGCTYTETGSNAGFVNGLIYTAAPPPTPACPSEGTAQTFAIAQAALNDANTAYNELAGLPASLSFGNLAGRTLFPGVHTAPGGSFLIQGGDLTLDAQGNANAVWVFQMATTLTVGGPGAAFPQSVILINGAQAKNVFWQVGSAATINAGGGGTMVGTIISQSGADFSTAGNVAIVTLNGRALSLNASVTLVNTVINVPAP